MICGNCGSQLNEGMAFCPVCGAQINAEACAQDQYDYNSTNVSYYTQENEEIKEISKKSLIWGILAAAFALHTCIPFLGIFFASKSNGFSDEYESYMGSLNPMARVGRILSKVGKIAGIVLTIVYAVYLVIYALYFAFYGALVFGALGGF